jgi:hypothetical protein
MKMMESTGASPQAEVNRMRRVQTWRVTDGRCWYCGGAMADAAEGYILRRFGARGIAT